MMRDLDETSGLIPRAVTLLPAVQVFSQVGKILGLNGCLTWLKGTRKRMLGPTTVSALWKRRRSKPRRATYSPPTSGPVLPWRFRRVAVPGCSRARISPKCGAPGLCARSPNRPSKARSRMAREAHREPNSSQPVHVRFRAQDGITVIHRWGCPSISEYAGLASL